MSGTEDQLIHFFAYSFFIYPVTNYIVSPQRKYSRFYGVIFAILFLSTISLLHLMYENQEKGPNHYQLLQVTRGTSQSMLKKAFRRMSLELHPDKNTAATASEDFRKVKHAYDVLQDAELRSAYDRLGEPGVKIAAHGVVDHKHIIIQMVVHYASTLILAFLMTFSEKTGDALSASLFGMAVMLLVETLLILEEFKIPVWMLPTHTSHDVVSIFHKLFPAYMSGCRCIIGSLIVDRKEKRVEALQALLESTRIVNAKALAVVQLKYDKVVEAVRSMQRQANKSLGAVTEGGLMERALRHVRTKVEMSTVKTVKEKAVLIADAKAFKKQEKRQSKYEIFKYLAMFLAARYLLQQSASLAPAATDKK